MRSRLALIRGSTGQLALLCLLYLTQRTLIYPGTLNRVAASVPKVEGGDVFRIATGAGTVDVIFLPATDGAEAGPKPPVIYARGNG
jgi:hypothetical protein